MIFGYLLYLDTFYLSVYQCTCLAKKWKKQTTANAFDFITNVGNKRIRIIKIHER